MARTKQIVSERTVSLKITETRPRKTSIVLQNDRKKTRPTSHYDPYTDCQHCKPSSTKSLGNDLGLHISAQLVKSWEEYCRLYCLWYSGDIFIAIPKSCWKEGTVEAACGPKSSSNEPLLLLSAGRSRDGGLQPKAKTALARFYEFRTCFEHASQGRRQYLRPVIATCLAKENDHLHRGA